MKLIEIQQQFFRLKGQKTVYFCTEAETDACLNVKVVHYLRSNSKFELPADWQNAQTRTLRGDEISKIEPTGEGLGMAYRPAAEHVNVLNTQTPDSMGNDIHNALEKLKKAVGGDVTDFVCERLQWSREEIAERLFAEQVDAVALILYNFEARGQAMIIGDQTGIGKGRIASSIIRYSKVHGLIPIYCTENAGLFSDNYRDLCDIGCADLVPFIVNSSASGQTNACITTLDENDENVVVYRPITDKKVKDKIFRSGELPEGYDYVLTTYSQLKNAYKKTKDGTVDGDDFMKYYWLKQLAPHATFIFDESHNISGSKVVVEEWWKPDAEVTLGGSNQFFCFNNLCKIAENAVFLSATFAKRPENLVVYSSRTCIAEAGLRDTELIQAISDGGEALQEVISSDIVGEGQMIRRESVYEGIKVNYIYLDKNGAAEFGTPDLEKQHRQTSDYITGIINDINKFEQDYVMPIIDGMNEVGSEYGESTKKTSNQTGAQHTPLFSKLFQIVNQLLFSIKAEAVADHAVRRLQEGKKVVIGVSSTMEAFIEAIDDEKGDEISCDFALVLDKALENTLKYKTTGEGEFEEKSMIDIDQLDADGQDMYFRIKDKIASASSGISISPIDIITQKIEAAINPETGEHFTVAEVTGRKRKIEFTNAQGTAGRIVPRKYVTRNVAFSKFQNNQADVLIINASGATGASAHATTKNTNLRPEQVKPRVMIIAQTELDVNKEVQKRGRINRTGQIKSLPPSYDYLISAIPAEKRLMMMLQKKLKSLDANSTSNQKQSTTVIDVPDFFNKYGDAIAYDYLLENREINLKLNEQATSSEKEDTKAPDEFLKKVSGYVPLLTCEEQEDFYNTILENYLKHIDNLKKKGEYDLEVEAMDLDAELIGDLKPLVGASAGESKFADAAYQGTYMCKVLRKPFNQSEVQAMLANTIGDGDAKATAKELADRFREKYNTQIEDRKEAILARYNREVEQLSPDLDYADRKEKENQLKNIYNEKFNNERARIEAVKSRARFIEFFYAGRACIVDGDYNTKAICLGAEVNEKAKNPLAPSNITISFAVASSTKSLEYNIADKDTKALEAIMGLSTQTSGYYGYTDYDKKYLENWNDYCKEATADREQRIIIVGNILRGYKNKPDRSKLISFTTHDGNVMKGLLTPKQSGMADGEQKLILTKYSVLKFKPVMAKYFTDGETHIVNLTRGMVLWIDGREGSKFDFDVRCSNAATFKKLEKMQDWLNVSPDGRGFEMAGYGSNKRWEMSFYGNESENKKAFNEVCELLEKYQFQVELSPAAAEQYFGKTKNTLKQGNWKPLTTNPANIPASAPQPKAAEPQPAAKPDRKRAQALLLLAKAKIKIAQAQQAQRMSQQAAGVGALMIMSNGFKDHKPMLTIDSEYDSKHINNLAPSKNIPDSLIEIINKGITLEQLDELSHLPICHYKTQITIHGNCPTLKDNKVYGYSALVVNSNKSLGVRWLAIDRKKKGRIADYVGEYDFATFHDSQVFCYQKDYQYTKENKAEVQQKIMDWLNSIDRSLFYGYIDILDYDWTNSSWVASSSNFTVVIYLQGIYERNIQAFLEAVCQDSWANIEAKHGEFIKRMEQRKKEAEQEKIDEENRKKKAAEDAEVWKKENPFPDKFVKMDFDDLQADDIVAFYYFTGYGTPQKRYYQLYLNYRRLCYRYCDENGKYEYKGGHVLERRDLPEDFWVWRQSAATTRTATASASERPTRGDAVEIVDYGDNEVAVLGYTKNKYWELKNLGGGRWNKYIRIDGRPMAQGWCFPRSKRAELEEMFGIESQPANEPEPIEPQPQPTEPEPKFKIGDYVCDFDDGSKIGKVISSRYDNDMGASMYFYKLEDVNSGESYYRAESLLRAYEPQDEPKVKHKYKVGDHVQILAEYGGGSIHLTELREYNGNPYYFGSKYVDGGLWLEVPEYMIWGLYDDYKGPEQQKTDNHGYKVGDEVILLRNNQNYIIATLHDDSVSIYQKNSPVGSKVVERVKYDSIKPADEPKTEQPDRKRAMALLMLAKAKIKIAQAQQAQKQNRQ